MAPTNSSATATQQNRLRTRVVPAIPLTYLQKRKQQQEAASVKSREEEAFKPVPVELLQQPSPSPPASDIAPPISNGIEKHDVGKPADSTAPTSPKTLNTTETIGGAAAESDSVVTSELPGSAMSEEVLDSHQSTPRSAPASESRSSASRSTYHMPPPFVPASQSNSNNNNNNNGYPDIRAPQPNLFTPQHHSMHHSHPSFGSTLVSGLPSSNHSSPAPPSAGNAPPYPYPNAAGHHVPHPSFGNHNQHMMNGFSPMGPPGPAYHQPRPEGFMGQGPVMDFSRRQLPGYGLSDNYSPSPTPIDPRSSNGFGTSTPQSFHGSQSSGTHDYENGAALRSQYYPTAIISNGNNGQIDAVRLYHPSRTQTEAGAQFYTSTQNLEWAQPAPFSPNNHDGLINYIQQSFGNQTFSDCTLELRFSDDRYIPFSIPGHKLLLAQSSALQALLDRQGLEGSNEHPNRLLLVSNDRFLRPDAYLEALRRIYAFPLLNMNSVVAIGYQSRQSGFESLDLGLGYAAAGHLLGIRPIVNRGVEIAGESINWLTVEKALDFALDGGLNPHWIMPGTTQNAPKQTTSTYGAVVDGLIKKSLAFLLNNFPSRFQLDTTVADPIHNSRLPFVHDARPNGHNPRLSAIKFGDHTSEVNVQTNGNLSPNLIASRILLNLPFHLLKYILESPTPVDSVGVLADPITKQSMICMVIDEREKRRLKVANSGVPESERKHYSEKWEVVGWKESFEVDAKQIPILSRTWVDCLGSA